ncbi:UNVERIFIED_CONTAM: hypothetical protein FKN15_008944 [Acipenser sinensis]
MFETRRGLAAGRPCPYGESPAAVCLLCGLLVPVQGSLCQQMVWHGLPQSSQHSRPPRRRGTGTWHGIRHLLSQPSRATHYRPQTQTGTSPHAGTPDSSQQLAFSFISYPLEEATTTPTYKAEHPDNNMGNAS